MDPVSSSVGFPVPPPISKLIYICPILGPGNEYLDQVTIANSLAVKGQSIGAAVIAAGPPGLDGILGYVVLEIANFLFMVE